jgi:hypothetical protein
MEFGKRIKPKRKSRRLGFVEARLEELRRRWENATGDREKSEISSQIREWSAFKPEVFGSGKSRAEERDGMVDRI